MEFAWLFFNGLFAIFFVLPHPGVWQVLILWVTTVESYRNLMKSLVCKENAVWNSLRRVKFLQRGDKEADVSTVALALHLLLWQEGNTKNVCFLITMVEIWLLQRYNVACGILMQACRSEKMNVM